jgi:hypothetical protein
MASWKNSGSAGMDAVYEAEDISPGRRHVIKNFCPKNWLKTATARTFPARTSALFSQYVQFERRALSDC